MSSRDDAASSGSGVLGVPRGVLFSLLSMRSESEHSAMTRQHEPHKR
jgi:hypothetical protein